MSKCVNIKHPEFIELQKQVGINPLVLSAKVGVWMEENNQDRFPTKEELKLNNNQNIVLGSSLNNETKENENTPPVGDNYGAFLKFKQDQLKQLYINKNLLTNRLVHSDTKENRKLLKSIEINISKAEAQIEKVQKRELELMLQAMISDLQDIEKALTEGNIADIDKVSSTLDFYQTFIIGENKEYKTEHLSEFLGKDFDALYGRISRLVNNRKQYYYNTTLKILSENEQIQNFLNNPDNKKRDEETGNLRNFTVEDLLKASKDLNYADTYFLGVISSNSNDTIIPQFLHQVMLETRYKNQIRVAKMKDRIIEFENKHKIYNPDWIFSTDSDGNRDGYLINIFSREWFKEQNSFKMLLNDFKEKGNSNGETYLKIVGWLGDNSNVINFTKLSKVKEIYSKNAEYNKYFKYTDSEIERYENKLKELLGPFYEETIQRVLNKLEKFEELKNSDEIEGSAKNFIIARSNLWEFMENYSNSMTRHKKILFDNVGFFHETYFSNFEDLVIIPKSVKTKNMVTDEGFQTTTVNSGFYNEKFREAMKDSTKMEYYSLIREALEYINNTYESSTNGRLSLPKIDNTFVESTINTLKDKDKNLFGKLGTMTHDMLHSYKAIFYDQDSVKPDRKGVYSNYVDRSKKEISERAKTYILKGMKKEDAYNLATIEVNKHYSKDLSRDIKGLLDLAALHNTRLEIAPIAKVMFDTYKNVTYTNNAGEVKERINGIKRTEYFIDHIIYNNVQKYLNENGIESKKIFPKLEELLKVVTGDKNKTLMDEKSFSLLSENEKEIFKNLKELRVNGPNADFLLQEKDGFYLQKIKDNYFYAKNIEEFKDENGDIILESILVSKEEFEEKFKEYIDNRVKKLGLDMTVAGLVNGVLKTIILKNLAINPTSGFFNRVEGKHSAMIMDATGLYWTEGNIDKANEIMSWCNLNKTTFKKMSKMGIMDKAKTIEIFDLFAKKLGTIQDKKNELQRNVSESNFNMEWFNLMKWAVDNPEFKNQGSIMLAIMMDYEIKDKNGNTVKLLNPDTKQFSCFEIDNGILKFKEEFSNIDFESFTDLISKMTLAVSRSQGNYSEIDIMMIKKHIWGKAGMIFMTWFPEHLHQRFGTNPDDIVDLPLGRLKPEGRFVKAFKANKVIGGTSVLSALGISYGMLGIVGAIGGGAITAIVFQKYLKKIYSEKSVRKDVNYIGEFIQMLFSIGIEMINYPSRMLQSIPGMKYLRVKNKTFEKTNMTKEEIGAVRAMSRELAIMLSLLSLKLAVVALYKGIGGGDDDEEHPARMKYYYIQNQLSRAITSLNSFSNPYELITDNSRFAFLKQLSDTYKLAYEIGSFQFDKVPKDFLNVIPIPRILHKGKMPYHDLMDYSIKPNLSGIPNSLSWTGNWAKNQFTDGEFEAKKEYMKIRNEIREESREKYMSELGTNKKSLSSQGTDDIVNKIGKKPKGWTYKEAVEWLEEHDKFPIPEKKKRGRKSKKEKEEMEENTEK